ncbi:MAG: amidohydrolase family protein [Pyrinomonadaceae bacterium]|nr:amidohydrolase family protein [Pyrinomonadaceae bacterium]
MKNNSGLSRRDFLKAASVSLIISPGMVHRVAGAVVKDVVLIRNGHLIDGTGKEPNQNTSILIENGKFKEISRGNLRASAGALIIDAAGKTVLPGLIDMHAHLISGGFDTLSEKSMSYDPVEQKRALKQMLYWGVTVVYVPVQPLESGLQLRTQVARGAFPSPRLFISGPGFTAPGGWGGANQPAARIELKDLREIKPQVHRLARAKVDILKLFYDDMTSSFIRPLPKLEKRLMEAVIKEAHARKLKVMVHAYRTEDHKDAIRAGADIMAHSAITDLVDDEYIRLAKKSQTLYLATLSVYHDVFDEKSIREFIGQEFVQKTVPKKTLDTLKAKEPLDSFEKTIKQDFIKKQLSTIGANLKKLSENGIPIGVGPDTGVPGSFPGIAVHREMELMVQSGVTPARVLMAATKTAAEYLGQKSLGTVELGKIADLLVVDGNPLEDIKNTRNIEVVIKAGQVVDREKLLREIMVP